MPEHEKRPRPGGRQRVATTDNINSNLSTADQNVLDTAGWVIAFKRDGREDPDLRRLLPAALADFCLALRRAGAS